MTRETLTSVRSQPAPRGADRQVAPAEAGAADFGSWLTHDLRVKGAPRSRASGAPPSAAPEPPPVEVQLAAPATEPRDERSEFARWLIADLAPRKRGDRDSSAPRGGPDSLAPQEVTPPPAQEGSSLRPAEELEEDDLAVLPGRARSSWFSARQRRQALLVAGLLLFGLGISSLRGRVSSEPASAAAAEQAEQRPTELLPPPPSEVPPVESEVEAVTVAPPERAQSIGRVRQTTPEVTDGAHEEPFSGARGGPNVARYPDLPSPTLSRLAREEREQARRREDEARRAARRAGSPASGAPEP